MALFTIVVTFISINSAESASYDTCSTDHFCDACILWDQTKSGKYFVTVHL